MGAEDDKSSHVEPGKLNMSGTATPIVGQKVSIFAAKTGFVIPKNKLSGSLVPIFRGNKKLGVSELGDGENEKQAQRKTKWGPDLMQDTAVRKGRILAYQTRLEQITQLLKSGTLDALETQDSALEIENKVDESPGNQDSQVHDTELLELEKREVIGEILKLNPSYKAPHDYRPLLKEDRFSLPIKEYPGYNFIGLIYGPNGENQKRLEKETGVKIRICGIKAETGEKDEIKSTDGHEIQNAYEQLYAYLSADTFDKIEAAISVIELLITSVSGNLTTVSTSSDLVSGDNKSFSSHGEPLNTSDIVKTSVLTPVMQQVQVYASTPMQGQFHYPSTWFPPGPSNNFMPNSGFSSQTNPSTIPNNPVNFSAPNPNVSNVPSLYGRPPPLTSFNPAFQNPPLHSPGQQLPAHGLLQPFMSKNSSSNVGPPMMIQRPPPLIQSNVSTPNFTGSNPFPSRGPPSLPQPVPSPGSLSDRPMTPIMISSGFSGATVNNPSSFGPNNMSQMAKPLAPPFGPPLQGVTSGMAPAITVVNVDPFPTFPSGSSTLQASGLQTNRPTTTSIPSPQMGPRPPFTAPAPPQPSPSLRHAGNFIGGSASTPPKPPTNAANFTFQPRGPQNPSAQTVVNPNIQNSPTMPALQQSAPGAPSFHPTLPNFPRFGNQVFPGPRSGNQMGNPQIQELAASNSNTLLISPRLPAPAFRDSGPRPQMNHRNFSPAPAIQLPNFPGNFPPRPTNPMQFEPGFRPEIRFASNQHFSGNRSANPGGQQIYDPFSPTSVSITQQRGNNPGK